MGIHVDYDGVYMWAMMAYICGLRLPIHVDCDSEYMWTIMAYRCDYDVYDGE